IHLMLMGLKRPLKRGDHFALTLTFKHAKKLTVQVEVAKIGASAPDMDHMRHVDEMGGGPH
ncbi:MAG: copper chaperone PCu(A)C, partial [Stellaceae bacterium]